MVDGYNIKLSINYEKIPIFIISFSIATIVRHAN